MPANKIVEAIDIAGNGVFGLDAGMEHGAPDRLGSRGRPNGSCDVGTFTRGRLVRARFPTVVVRRPPPKLSLITRKSSSDIWVNCGLPAHSPIAQVLGAVASRRSLTRIIAALGEFDPRLFEADPLRVGGPPAAKRMSLPSITRCPSGVRAMTRTLPPDLPTTFSNSVDSITAMPSASRIRWSSSETSGSSRFANRAPRSMTVTRLPKRR